MTRLVRTSTAVIRGAALSLSPGLLSTLAFLLALPAGAQSFQVQCPTSTITHPDPTATSAEPAYTAATQYKCSVLNGCGGSAGTAGYLVPSTNTNGAVKCQQVSGGDGYATMADGTQTYMFSFGPLSGLADIAAGKPGTEFPSVFNSVFPGNLATPLAPLQPGDPATTNGATDTPSYSAGTLGTFNFNGAVGLSPDIPNIESIYDISEGCSNSLVAASCASSGVTPNTVTVILNRPSPFKLGESVNISGTGANPATGPYDGVVKVTAVGSSGPGNTIFLNPTLAFPNSQAFQYVAGTPGLAQVTASTSATAASIASIDGHVDPRQLMDIAVMNGNIPAPLMAIDEDDEFFLTLSNVGMIMRPDLFEQHTIHFHGYPNASSFYDGVPDASVAINIGSSFTYYYLAPDAGTYFWHCHITPPEHLQMGMVGQLYVRPRQNRVPLNNSLYAGLNIQQGDLRTACNSANDILCSNPLPIGGSAGNLATRAATGNYAYNDGDGSTYYDVEYPIQIHGFDPNFHFVGMTFNLEGFTDMKDKYFLLNGRSYPDTVEADPMVTQTSDGSAHYSQPMNSIINIPAGKKALLRISDLDVTEYQTLALLGIPMKVIGYNAKLLRDQAGNNMYYNTNSITLGGGESLDVILDATGYTAGQVFYLYTPNLDHLSNDAENFGGLMTEVRIVDAAFTGAAVTASSGSLKTTPRSTRMGGR